jgi:sensor histidine kinase YesM
MSHRPLKRYIPYSYKLMSSYLVFVLIAVSVIGFMAYRTSVASIREQARENIHGILQQMRDNIVYKAEEVKRISDQIYYDTKLQTYLRYYESGWYSYEVTNDYMMPIFASAVNVYREAALMKVYLANPTMPEVYKLQDEHLNPMRFAPGFEILQESRLGEQSWHDDLLEIKENYRGNTIMWRQIENDKTFGHISLLRTLVDFEQRKRIGVTRTIVRLDSLLSAVDHQRIGPGTEIVVLDSGDASIKSSRLNADKWWNGNQTDHLVIKEEIPELGMSMVAYIPNQFLIEDANKVRTITWMVCAISTLLLLVAAFLISNYYSKRVHKIVHSLGAFREGSFHKRISFSGNDEFSRIAKEFNVMAENIEELIKEVYLANMLKSEAELDSLQSQINPHFLYNTLSSMSRLAKFGENEQLHDMIMALARFYRLTLNKGKTLISIYHELEQVKAYVQIQKIKYRERVQIYYDIDSDVLQFDTVKIILQPFVENSLQHALFGKVIHLRISIRRVNDDIEFKVIDDGVGMRRETIRQIFLKDGVGIGYGIRNVDARIKLQFGQSYGVELFSIWGAGTCARILIPAHMERHGVRQSPMEIVQ